MSIKEYIYQLLNDSTPNVGDYSIGGITVAAALIKVLPTISLGLSIVWVILRIIVTIRDDFLKKKKEE